MSNWSICPSLRSDLPVHSSFRRTDGVFVTADSSPRRRKGPVGWTVTLPGARIPILIKFTRYGGGTQCSRVTVRKWLTADLAMDYADKNYPLKGVS